MKPQLFLPIGHPWDGILSILNTWRRLRYFPRFRNPRSLNEFLLREKLWFSGDMVLARTLTDKVEFKDWLKNNGFAELVIETNLVVDRVEDFSSASLPSNCVIKPSHSSGDMLMLRDRTASALSCEELKRIEGLLREDYYKRGREPNDRRIKPRVIVEELLLDEQGQPPKDFKIFRCHGEPFLIQVGIARFAQDGRQLYASEWELLPFCMSYKRHPEELARPPQLKRAIELASALSAPFALCRVDFYFLNESEIKAGEMIFFPGNCSERFDPPHADLSIGRAIRPQMKKRMAM